MGRIFSYAFTTAEASPPDDDGAEGGPYAAQYVGGSAVVGENGGSNLFAEITRKGIQAGLGTFYGLGYGLPMSGLYARYGARLRNRHELRLIPRSDTLAVRYNFLPWTDGVNVHLTLALVGNNSFLGSDVFLRLPSLDLAGDVEL